MRLPNREKSRAVLIGVGAYQRLPALHGVHSGASALREVLVDPRYGSLQPEHCVLVPELAAREDVGKAILRASAEAEDMLLLYFAGHGLKGARRHDLHLAVAGTDAENVTFTGIKYDDVRDVLLGSTARSKVVILDCCLSGRALSQRMAAADGIIDEVEIEGVATLTSVPPNHDSIILPGEDYPAYTGRLLKLLREGIPDAPELLNLTVLHRSLHKALRAAGLRQPQANLDALLDGLGLVRNRATTKPVPKPPEKKPEVLEESPLIRTLQPPLDETPAATEPPVPPKSPVRKKPAARPRTPPEAATYSPELREMREQAARLSSAASRHHRVPAAPKASANQPEPSPRLKDRLRSLLTAGVMLAFGSLAAFVLLSIYHDLLPEGSRDDFAREFGENTGHIVTGVLLIAIAGLFVLVTQAGLLRSIKLSVVTFLAGLLVGFGALFAFGFDILPVVFCLLATGAYFAFVRGLRWLVSRGGRVGGPA